MLNPVLYEKLIERFGEVRVRHEGEPFRGRYVADLARLGAKKLLKDWPGEEYVICCPFCGDTRFRLTINHRWGVWDEVVGHRNLWLANCYNERCLSDPARCRAFYEYVYRGKAADGLCVITNGEAAPAQPIRPPGMIMLLDELKRLQPKHDAIVYLERRGFSVEYLAREFKIGVVADSDVAAYRGRIYVPIYSQQELKGWQLRSTNDEHKTRWYSCPGMKKSALLYNEDTAFQHRVIVLVEGATSAWAVGKRAVASFGKSISKEQWRKLEHVITANRGLLCLMLDPDDIPSSDESHHLNIAYRQSQEYTGLKHRVVRVWLPPGTDPASVPPDLLKTLLANSIKSNAEVLRDEIVSPVRESVNFLRI
jgi:hypothetical protein